MNSINNIVILTGAGVSAESGVATFRGPDGLWEGHRVEDVATPEAFARDPDLVQQFYDERRAKLKTVEPNKAHKALAKLDQRWPGDLLLVTQNVDDLHDRAGSQRLLHMHGELNSAWCLACDARAPFDGVMADGPPCPECDRSGQLRPDIVWFGADGAGVGAVRSVRVDRYVGRGLSGGRLCPERPPLRRADAGNESRPVGGQLFLSRKPDGQGR